MSSFYSKPILTALFIIFWLLFYFKGVGFLDTDFGWHLRMGRLILDNGIPQTDPFSYTMASYPFVDHEWLTNVLLYLLHSLYGIEGLSAIFATLTTLAIIIALPHKPTWQALPVVFLTITIVFSFTGVRTQVISWIFLSVLLKILTQTSTKLYLFLPILFIFWANLHGSFAAGIALFLVTILVHVFSQKTIPTAQTLIFVVCLLATFVNPYGWRAWWEVWMQISDHSLRFRIAEWMPPLFNPDLAFTLMLTITILTIFRFRAKLPTLQITIFSFLLLMAISSQRHIPLWILTALPIAIGGVESLEKWAWQLPNGRERFWWLWKIFMGLTLVIFVAQNCIAFIQARSFSQANYYPTQAVSILGNRVLKPNVLAPYEWGGYLIWQLPNTCQFIDGRMPSWRWQAPNSKESNNAFDDYEKMLKSKEDLAFQINKYSINTVLWHAPKPPSDNPIGNYLQTKLNKFFPRSSNRQSENNSMEDMLVELGWSKIYQDNISIIYQRNP